jgi:hypothetical protein
MVDMAEGKSDKRKGRNQPALSANWAPGTLVSALKAARKNGDRVAALKRSGILDKDGHVVKKYKNWGKKVSRTPSAKEIATA